jgi:type IV pilus assembly protein PilX
MRICFNSHRARADCTQRGAALAIALLMLIVLLMLGLAAVRIGLQSEQMSRNRRDRQIAWQAAQAALLDAEYDIGNPDSPRYALFGNRQSATEANRDGENRQDDSILPGLYLPAADPRHPVWRGLGRTDGAPGVRYGSYSGRTMQTGIGALPAQPPRYLIEILPREAAQPSSDQSRRYRISALGFGPDPNTRVMLQSIYRRQPSAAGNPPSIRLNWREIATEDTE